MDEKPERGDERRACSRGGRRDARRTASCHTVYRIRNTRISQGTPRGPLFPLGDWRAAPPAVSPTPRIKPNNTEKRPCRTSVTHNVCSSAAVRRGARAARAMEAVRHIARVAVCHAPLVQCAPAPSAGCPCGRSSCCDRKMRSYTETFFPRHP